MAATHEAQESLRERARRALLDNPAHEAPPEASLPARHEPDPTYMDVDPGLGSTADQIELRLRAIRMVREHEPRRACYADRVKDLSHTLMQLPGDSIHYRAVLEKLQEAHGEWLALEEKLWAATYVIRSTRWLVDLLADPAASEREVSGHES